MSDDVSWVDQEDLAKLAGHSWSTVRSGKTKYAKATIAGRTVYMHRLIMNARPGEIIDHEDGDGVNNLRSNLRRCTHSQNARNSRGRPGRSQFKGVSRGAGRMAQRWKAAIKVDGKTVHLGYFEGTPEGERRAAEAYDSAARLYFGEFARTNFR